jgi:hypothetical protein
MANYTQYRVFMGSNRDALEEVVEKQLKDGWHLVGGVAVSWLWSKRCWQAMAI